MSDEALGMPESSDKELLDHIRRRGPLTVAEMGEQLGVTATAVRNRLSRLVESGLVERQAEHGGRGRPKHRTRRAPRRTSGSARTTPTWPWCSGTR